MGVRVGRFLPAGDPDYGSPLTVLGPTLKRELFGEAQRARASMSASPGNAFWSSG